MTDSIEPPPPPEERLPATRPAERVSAERFTAAPSAQGDRRSDAGAQRRHRSPIVERPVGRLPHRLLRDALHRRVLVLRARLAARLVRAAPRPGDRSPTGDRGRARLQRLPGELRPLPRPERAGPTRAGRRRGRLHRTHAQRPGEAVQSPQRELPPQCARGRRPLRLRQPELGDAALGRHGQSARSAQLPPGRRTHRVPPGHERARLRGEGPIAQRAGHRSRDGRGEDVHGLARSELDAGAGFDAVSGLLPRRPRRRRRRAAPGRLDRSERTGRDRGRADRRSDDGLRPRGTRGAGRHSLHAGVRQPGRDRSPQHRDQGSQRRAGEHRRHLVLYRTGEALIPGASPRRGRLQLRVRGPSRRP